MTGEGGQGRAGFAGRFSWALYDFANQPFFTLIVTFLFAPYFASHVIGDPVEGQTLWGWAEAAAGAAIAILSPALGAIADKAGRRKPWIAACTVIGAVLMACLWFAEPGAAHRAWAILAAIAVATVALEVSIVFNNAMLPDLGPEAEMGRLSGFGWGLGYLGGLLALGLMLILFILPDTPAFGLNRAAHEPDRLSGPFSAAWLVLFILPFFLFTPDKPSSALPVRQAARQGLAALWRTLLQARRHREVFLYLAARMLYNDGLAAIFAFGGIYAAGRFGWGATELGLFGVVIIVFSMAGAFAGGPLDDRFGSKPVIVVSILGAALALIGILLIEPAVETGGLKTDPERLMLALAALLGSFAGPMQAASRTFLARLAPPDMIAEFYGLYALSGKATAFAAPLAIGVVTSASGSQTQGVAVVLAFFAAGLILLLAVSPARAPGNGRS